MTAMFPIPVWQTGTLQPSTPVNDAFLRQEVLARGATSILSTPPGSPVDGEVHIVGASPTGAWSTFAANDVVLWRSGTWYRFAPFFGWLKQVGTEVRRFDGTAWVVVGGDGGGGAWDGTALLASNFQMAGASVQLIPNLRFTPDASSLYELELLALVRSDNVSTAPQVSIRTNSAADTIGGVSIVGQSGNSAAAFSFETASGADARIGATTAAGPGNSAQLVIGRALFRSTSAPGEVRVGLQASDNLNTVTMLENSVLRWKKLA